jgi:hypothetical protein
LTPSAWEHFWRIGEAQEAKNQLHQVVRFLERQAEEKLGLTRELYTHHCNLPNVIPHYPNWWSGERIPGNYFCRVCRESLSPHELLATSERTRTEWEVTRGGVRGETAPTEEETSELPTQLARLGSPTGPSGAGGGTQPRAQPGGSKGKERRGDPSSGSVGLVDEHKVQKGVRTVSCSCSASSRSASRHRLGSSLSL